MYGREYKDQVLSFEPSGALKQATLVMRDRETDSWWSIMSGDAIGGDMKGQRLEELPVGERTTWGKWRRKYPETRVLSVDGKEHDPKNPYQGYFDSEKTFRNVDVKDDRLDAKAPIFSFRLDAVPYAAPYAAVEGGAVFPVKGGAVFLYRRPGAGLFESTGAWFLAGAGPDDVSRAKDGWVDRRSGAAFTPGEGWSGARDGGEPPAPLAGFDTFWYSWANNNAHVVVLGKPE